MVSVAGRDDSVILTVTDDGKGVPPGTLAALGTPFSRPVSTEAEGSGLGLALVRRIAEWHGGTLDISAGDNGRVLRLSVTLLCDLRLSPRPVVLAEPTATLRRSGSTAPLLAQ